MAAITAALVKDLREKTGAGMMDCKKALTETDGDIETAVDWLRKKGLAAAAKKSGRVAAEGLVGVASAPLQGRGGRGQRRNRLRRPQRDVPGLRRARWRRSRWTSATTWTRSTRRRSPATSRTVAEQLTHLVATIGENMQHPPRRGAVGDAGRRRHLRAPAAEAGPGQDRRARRRRRRPASSDARDARPSGRHARRRAPSRRRWTSMPSIRRRWSASARSWSIRPASPASPTRSSRRWSKAASANTTRKWCCWSRSGCMTAKAACGRWPRRPASR